MKLISSFVFLFLLIFLMFPTIMVTKHFKIRMSIDPIKSIRFRHKKIQLLKNVILIPGPLSLLEYQMCGYHSK